MRNVSIVYKKSIIKEERNSLASMGHLNLGDYNSSHNPQKRQVNQYSSRMADKEKHRERILTHRRESLEKIRMRTSIQNRKNDQNNIIDTLNIASLPIQQQLTEEKRDDSKTHFRSLVARKLSLGKPNVSLFGLNINSMANPPDDHDNSKWSSLKLKCLFKPKAFDLKPTILVLSVNFILNEHYYWQEEQIQESAIKHWKMLQNYSNITWICEKQSTCKKLQKYSKINGLRLDGVYMVQQKRSKKMLTVSYNLIQADFGVRNSQKVGSPLLKKAEDKKMVVVNGLRVENTAHLEYSAFYNSIPIINNSGSIIHFTKVDLSDGARFGSVVKILSQSISPKPFGIMPIIRDFEAYQEENSKEDNCTCDIDDFAPLQKDLLVELEDLKMKLVKYMSQSMSMKMTLKMQDSSNSIQFLIGDTIRRNYRIFQNYRAFDEEYQLYKFHQAKHKFRAPSVRAKRKYSPQRFNNIVYLWNF